MLQTEISSNFHILIVKIINITDTHQKENDSACILTYVSTIIGKNIGLIMKIKNDKILDNLLEFYRFY